MILTEEEIKAIGVGAEKFARAVEAAVLEKLRQQEPAKYEFQNRDGTWHGFLNESHYQNTVEDGSWPIRALYAAPVPAAVPEGWRTLASDVLAYFDTPRTTSAQSKSSA